MQEKLEKTFLPIRLHMKNEKHLKSPELLAKMHVSRIQKFLSWDLLLRNLLKIQKSWHTES